MALRARPASSTDLTSPNIAPALASSAYSTKSRSLGGARNRERVAGRKRDHLIERPVRLGDVARVGREARLVVVEGEHLLGPGAAGGDHGIHPRRLELHVLGAEADLHLKLADDIFG